MSDDLPQTIGAVVTRAAERFGDAEAFVDGDVSLSFVELAAEVERSARALHRLRHRARRPGGDLGARTCVEWVVAALGTAHRGRRARPAQHPVQGQRGGLRPRQGPGPAPVHRHRLPRHRLRRAARRRRAACDTLEEIDRLAGRVAGRDHADGRSSSPGPTRSAPMPRPSGPPVSAGDDLSDILFTSGTTGHAEGRDAPPRRRHPGLRRVVDVVGLREGDRYLIVNPFFHAFGLKAGILACLIKGATIVPQPVFDVPTVMRAGRRASGSRCSPGRRRSTRRSSNHPDLDALRHVDRCAWRSPAPPPVPVEMVNRMRDELGFETIVTGYGLTEVHGIATMCRHDDDPETIANTVGPGHPRRRGAGRRRRRQRGAAAASPARSSSGATT